jgi:hypothetical protein
MKNRKNLLKIITCAFFVSGYSQIEKIIKTSLNLQQQQQHEQQENQYNKLTSVFK